MYPTAATRMQYETEKLGSPGCEPDDQRPAQMGDIQKGKKGTKEEKDKGGKGDEGNKGNEGDEGRKGDKESKGDKRCEGEEGDRA